MLKKKLTREMIEREQLVIETMRMRLNEKQSIAYIKGQGMKEISPATLYRVKAKVEEEKLYRLFAVGQDKFVDQHLARIDNTELGLKLLWQCFIRERSPFRQALIIEKIIAIQPYLSSFYEATKQVVEKSPIIQEKLKALQNRMNEDEILKEATTSTENSEQRLVQMLQKIEDKEKKEKEEKDDLKEKKEDNTISEGNNNDNGFQHITSESTEGKGVNLPEYRERDTGTGEDKRESSSLQEAEDLYRRTKAKGIFFNQE